MDLHELESVVAVSEYDSLEQAAAVLHVSKSTLSREIRRISDLVGAPLFNRGHHLTLTDAGMEYVNTAKEILSVREQAYKLMQQMENSEFQKIWIAVSPHIDSRLLGGIYPSFLEQYPQCRIELIEAYAGEAAEKVRRGQADIGLGFMMQKQSDIPDVAFLPIQKIEYLICLRDINESAAGGAVSPEQGAGIPSRRLDQFLDIPFIASKQGSFFEKMIGDWFKETGAEPLTVTHCPSHDMALAMIKAYNGFAILMMDDCSGLEGIRMFRADPPFCCYKGYYVRRDLKIPGYLADFMRSYANVIQSHYCYSASLYPTAFEIPEKMLDKEEVSHV